MKETDYSKDDLGEIRSYKYKAERSRDGKMAT